MAYAIVTTRLMDIEIVIKRGILYSSVAVVLTLIYFLIARLSELVLLRLTGYSGFWSAVPSIIVIAFLFQPTYERLQHLVDGIMFRKRYQYRKVINGYSHTLTRPTMDYERIAKLSPYIVYKAMKLTGASMLIINRPENRYEIRGVEGDAKNLVGFIVEEESALIKYVKKTKTTLVKDEIQRTLDTESPPPDGHQDLKDVIKQMERLKSVLIIPLISESEYFGEPTLLSMFCLGEKRSGEFFSSDDIAFLETMADQATITIEYALILEELEKSREKLIQSEKLAALGTMAAGVAHEIKNPLAALKLFTEVIPLKFGDPDYRDKFATLIPSELARLRRILADLESFSKPIEETTAPFSVKEVMEKTLQLLEVQFKKGSIKVVRELNETPPVTGNSSKMMQVFMNIIINAVHAMESGGILTVGTAASPANVVITIADTGTGIPKDKINLIFDPFYTTKETGTGLGLAITKRIVEEHGGKINVESEVGKGTKFTIRL